MRLAIPLAATLLCVGCASTGPPPDWPPDPSDRDGCMQIPEVRSYLHETMERILAAWQLPAGIAAHHQARVGFIVSEDGALVRSAIFEATSRSLGESALRAVESSAPFPVPPAARCIVGFTIYGNFTNPAHKQEKE